MELLHAAFHDPTVLDPHKTPVALTEGAAGQFGRLADALRNKTTGK